MCDKIEKSCPICTEVMDLTDQQLKPCKCGYEICVWCWHHIMEMSEKDGTSGRCPACRSPYDKERIVAMAANCQRLVAEMNSQRKKKMQKLKSKSTDGKKHLTDVRVIQRNLVYIIGLPLNLADEDLLQHREYFGRYGKVLKVSISRTATGLIQHSANNSCNLYITYSKEAEAIRCIQSVHCFVLEGRLLRACFGTTKYCHAWLRNAPCSNRDCLYLHDYGSQEDSFTKDELVLAFARSRVQQIIGATNNLHQRSGNVLPAPKDDPRLTSLTSKFVSKSSLDQNENQMKGSCLGSSNVSSTAPPAVTSWVMRVSGCLPSDTSSSSGSLADRKDAESNDPQVLVSVVNSTERCVPNARISGKSENNSEVLSRGTFVPSELNKHLISGNSQTCESDVIEVTVKTLPSTVSSNQETSLTAFISSGQEMVALAASTGFPTLSKPQCDFNIDKAVCHDLNRDIQGLCSDLSSTSMHNDLEDPYGIPDSDSLPFTPGLKISSIGQPLKQDNEYSEEHLTTPAFWEDIIVDDTLNSDYEQSKLSKGNDNLSLGHCSPCLLKDASHYLLKQDKICPQQHFGKSSELFNDPVETRFEEHVENKENANKVTSDMGESSIISDILSLELDAWEDSLVKLLGENEEQNRDLKAPTLRKGQDKNQSRFSFARQEDLLNETSDLEQSSRITNHVSRGKFTSNGLIENKDTLSLKYLNDPPNRKYLSDPPNRKYPHAVLSSNSELSDKFVGMSKAHASSPPGFSMSSRIPPPGFSRGRLEQNSNTYVKHLPQQFVPSSGNIGRIGDAQYNDLAVMEIGKVMLAERINNASFDMRHTLLSQFSPGEDNAILELLKHQSIPSQNLSQIDHAGNIYFPQNDAYRTSSRFPDQFPPNNPSIYKQLHSQQFSSNVFTSNGQWGPWHDTKNFNDMPLTQVLNNERRGLNNFMSSYESIKF